MRKVSMRCVGGPFAGQTLDLPAPRYISYPSPRYTVGPVPYLVNIWTGGRLCCYLTVQMKFSGSWYLGYQEEF